MMRISSMFSCVPHNETKRCLFLDAIPTAPVSYNQLSTVATYLAARVGRWTTRAIGYFYVDPSSGAQSRLGAVHAKAIGSETE